MADYRKKDTGDIHTEIEIRDGNPNISFPSSVGIQADMIEHLGYELVYDSTMPSASATTKVIVKDGVEQKDGKWWVKWSEVDRHTTYTDEAGNTVTKASQDTAYQTHLDETQKGALRAERIALLEEADWQMNKLEDAGSSTSDWKTYRQALRDITKASDIYNVTWPTKPS